MTSPPHSVACLCFELDLKWRPHTTVARHRRGSNPGSHGYDLGALLLIYLAIPCSTWDPYEPFPIPLAFPCSVLIQQMSKCFNVCWRLNICRFNTRLSLTTHHSIHLLLPVVLHLRSFLHDHSIPVLRYISLHMVGGDQSGLDENYWGTASLISIYDAGLTSVKVFNFYPLCAVQDYSL